MEAKSSLTCLLMYHRRDINFAKWIQGIVQEEGITCHLLYEVAGADIHTDMFRCANDVDCVISLITKSLFAAEKERKFHSKVSSYINGEKYIAVRIDIDDETFCSPEGAFLEGCHVLAPEQMSDTEFRKCLTSEIKAVASRISLGQRPDYDLSSETNNSSHAELLIPAISHENILNFGDDLIEDILLIALSALVSLFELKFSENEALMFTVGKNKVMSSNDSSGTTNDGDISKNLTAPMNDVAAQASMDQPNMHAVAERVPESLNSFQSASDTIGFNYSSALKLKALRTAPDQSIKLSEEQLLIILRSYCNAARDNEKLCDDVEVAGATGGKPNNSIANNEAISYLSNMLRKPEKDIDEDGRPKFLPYSKQMLQFSEHNFTEEERLTTKQILRTGLPNQFLRSPFLVPILSVRKLQIGFEITTPQASINLKTWIKWCADIDKLNEETALELCRSYFLRIVCHVAMALDFLRARNIVHGNVNPENIVIDEFGNVRLDNTHGLQPEEFDSQLRIPEVAHDSSIVGDCDRRSMDAMFAITIWQILKCSTDRQLVADEVNTKLLTVPEADMSPNVHRLWLNRSGKVADTTACLCSISLQYLNKSSKTFSPVSHLKSVLTKHRFPLYNFPNNRCVYCVTGTPKQNLEVRSSNCPEKCKFFKICQSCLPSICSGRYFCPQHDTQIFPPVGGINSCALIISGRDEDTGTQQTFDEDAHEMMLAASHPHVMAIPWRNIYRISPSQNSTAADINHILRCVVDQQPDFFLLFYSGHMTTESELSSLNVSEEQGNALDKEILQKSLLSLIKACPKILVVFDCCYAANFCTFLQQTASTKDSHIIFHTVLAACRRNEPSNIQPLNANSLFTKCFVAGLKGGRQCPNSVQGCPTCERFRNATEAEQCVVLTMLEDFVSSHMKDRYLEAKDDLQNPVVNELRRGGNSVIAYFRNRILYNFLYEAPSEQNFPRRVCELDSLGYVVDEVLESLWNQLKQENLPNQLDHQALEILFRKHDSSVHVANEIRDIIEAVYENPDSLCVGIRTDGSKLHYKKSVVCFIDASQAKNAMKTLPDSEKMRCQKVERDITEFMVEEISPAWYPSDNIFDITLQKCWNRFLSVIQQHAINHVERNFIQIEIYEKLSLFSIVTEKQLI